MTYTTIFHVILAIVIGIPWVSFVRLVWYTHFHNDRPLPYKKICSRGSSHHIPVLDWRAEKHTTFYL